VKPAEQSVDTDSDHVLAVQHRLALALSSTEDLEEGLCLSLDAALQVCGGDAGGIYLVDTESGALKLAVHQGLPEDFRELVSHFADDSPNAALVRAGKPVYLRYRELRAKLGLPAPAFPFQAIAVIPVKSGEQVLCALNVTSREAGSFSPQARTAMETIASSIGGAILRLRSEAARRRVLGEYRALFDGVQDAILVTSAGATGRPGRFVDCNGYACELLGSSREEMLRLSPVDVIAEKARPTLRTIRRQLLSTGRVSAEIEGRHRDGHEIPLEIDIHTMAFRKRGMTLTIARDVSHRKTCERELRELARRLVSVSEDERAALGREMHDEFAQMLVAMRFKLDAFRKQAKYRINDADRELLSGVLAQIEEVMLRTRAIVSRLHPRLLDQKGLAQALSAMGSILTSDGGINVTLDGAGLVTPLPEDVSQALYRIAQEAITNAAKHSKGEEVAVRLYEKDDFVRLTVTDNGVGFDPETHGERSLPCLGLVSMRERALSVGGHLTLDSAPGKGARVCVTVPLP